MVMRRVSRCRLTTWVSSSKRQSRHRCMPFRSVSGIATSAHKLWPAHIIMHRRIALAVKSKACTAPYVCPSCYARTGAESSGRACACAHVMMPVANDTYPILRAASAGHGAAVHGAAAGGLLHRDSERLGIQPGRRRVEGGDRAHPRSGNRSAHGRKGLSTSNTARRDTEHACVVMWKAITYCAAELELRGAAVAGLIVCLGMRGCDVHFEAHHFAGQLLIAPTTCPVTTWAADGCL